MAYDSAYAGSEIVIVDKDSDRDGLFEYYKERILSSGERICNKEISKGFIEESLDMCDLLFIHTYDYGTRGEKGIRGFACVMEITVPKHYLYIDLICNMPFHMETRHTRGMEKYGGKHMLNKIRDLAIDNDIYEIRLKALDHVISYYYHLGYRFENSRLQHDITDKIVSKLRKALKEGNMYESERILGVIVKKYYPKFYSETKQAELASVPREERIEKIREDGIPMVLMLPKEAEDIEMTGGNKNKRRKHSTKKRRHRNKTSKKSKKRRKSLRKRNQKKQRKTHKKRYRK